MAGITHLKEFQKPTLRGLVDETVKARVPKLADKYLPNAEIYSRTFAYDIIKNNQYIAAMIAYGAEAPIVDRDAVASKMGEIAKMGLKYVVTEEELLAIHEARNSGEKNAMVDKLVTKGLDLVEAIQKRVDVIKMEAIAKGAFSYNKNGVKVNVDFGIPAEHKVALTGGSDWTDVDRDVIGDLLGYVATYEATNGQTPEDLLVSREVLAALSKNKLIIAEAGKPAGSTRANLADVNAVLSANGLPQLTVVTDRKITVRNVYTGQDEVIEFMPKNRVILVSGGVGNFLYGVTVENDFKPGMNLSAYDKDEPIESVIKAVAAGFPALEKPGLIFHADVIPA